jgi:hypothetical protein
VLALPPLNRRVRLWHLFGGLAIASASAALVVAGTYQPGYPLPTDSLSGTLPPAGVSLALATLELSAALFAATATALVVPGHSTRRLLFALAALACVIVAVHFLDVLVWRLTHPVDAGNCC